MTARLRRFAAVGVVATLIDVTLAVVLVRSGWSALWSDVVALVAAALVAYALHRRITLRDDPMARWIHEPTMFLAVVVIAGMVDVALFSTFAASSTGGLLVRKSIAVLAAAVVRGLMYRSLLFRVVRSEQDQPRDEPLPATVPHVSVIIPAFREADRIAGTIRRVRAELEPSIGAFELVVVDDGSSDQTATVAREAGADVVVVLPENLGKGGAVRAGMLQATGQIRAFTDADLAYSPRQLIGLIAKIDEGYDMVVGNRRHVATRTLVRAGRLREIGGRLVNVATHALLLGHYRDTQSGLKAFRADVADDLFSAGRLNGFSFDVELFHLAERRRFSLAEVPVTVENNERSTVNVVRDGVRLVRDLFRIRGYARSGVYDRATDLRTGDVSRQD